MKFKLMSFFITLASVLAPPAMAEVTQEQVQAQCLAVGTAVDAFLVNPTNQLKVSLILGAMTQESPRFLSAHEGSGASPMKYIYLDVRSHQPSDELHVQADFNNLEHLRALSAALAGKVNIILFDHSVYKFAFLHQSHLLLFKAMLRPGGTFFMPLEPFLPVTDKGTYLNAGDTVTGEAEKDIPYFVGLCSQFMEKQEKVGALTTVEDPPAPNTVTLPLGLVLYRNLLFKVAKRVTETWFMTRMQSFLIEKGGFSSVNPVHFQPLIQKVNPHYPGGDTTYLACKP
jgi:hypothetical protein